MERTIRFAWQKFTGRKIINMCTRCREVKNEWFVIIRDKKTLTSLKKKFDIIYGKGEFDKMVNGKDWIGKCRKCKTAFIIKDQKYGG